MIGEYILKKKEFFGTEFLYLESTTVSESIIQALSLATDYDSIEFRCDLNSKYSPKLESWGIHRLEHKIIGFEPHEYTRLMDMPAGDVDRLAEWMMVSLGMENPKKRDTAGYNPKFPLEQIEKTHQRVHSELEVLQLTERLLVTSGRLVFPNFYLSVGDWKKVAVREIGLRA